MPEAHKHWEDACGWLDSSIRGAGAGRWTVSEAYARKDRALLYLAQDQVAEADTEARKAEDLFRSAEFAEGLAHISRVRGMILQRQGDHVEAKKALRASLEHFTRTGEPAEEARTQWEIARMTRAAGEPRPLITREYASALAMAETCRRAGLVWGIGEEFKVVNPEKYYSHVFRRVRGRGIPDSTDSLIDGTSEPITVLFLDLKDSTSYGLDNPPEVVMTTLNQMLADMVAVLRKHDALVSGFRGDGFMAIFRGQRHAFRAVSAGVELSRQMDDFNEPREILGLRLFQIRIGISTGPAVLGNVGTYDLMDYTAIGTTANLGARLESVAKAGWPCISRQTHDEVLDRFRSSPESPRTVAVIKGLESLGPQQVWDVIGEL
jgi:class 3 adenylate cyclase